MRAQHSEKKKTVPPRYKIVFVGNAGVGKTSIIHAFIDGRADPNQIPTVGIDFLSKLVYIGDKLARLQFWDTAGQERFRSLTPSYIKDSSIACIVYDVTSKASFEAVDSWVKQTRQVRGENAKIVLIGNKNDLQHDRQVTMDEGYEKSKALMCSFMEVSAKRGVNIQELFSKVVALIERETDNSNAEMAAKEEDHTPVRLQEVAPAPKKKGCC